MTIGEVVREFTREMKTFATLDEMQGHSRMETTIWVQTIFLRASCRLFHADDKADFARMAKIAWDTVHGKKTL